MAEPRAVPGRRGFRAWLYRIATNACLDALRRSARRVPELQSFAEVPWLQPYPDRLLDEIAPSHEQPDAVVVARETIERAPARPSDDGAALGRGPAAGDGR